MHDAVTTTVATVATATTDACTVTTTALAITTTSAAAASSAPSHTTTSPRVQTHEKRDLVRVTNEFVKTQVSQEDAACLDKGGNCRSPPK